MNLLAITHHGYCRCIDVPTSSFRKNEVYIYEKYFGIHTEYVSFFVGGKFVQNLPVKYFEKYFVDLQKERDIKLDKILE